MAIKTDTEDDVQRLISACPASAEYVLRDKGWSIQDIEDAYARNKLWLKQKRKIGDSMTNCEEAYDYYNRKAEQQAKEQQEKDFEAMAKAAETYLQKWGHPHMTVIAQLDGIEVVEGIKAKPFVVLD